MPRSQQTELKLKQASAVLGVPPKELQNLVQFGVVKPRRRNGACLFDRPALCQAEVAEYLKSALGISTQRLALFAQALAKWMSDVAGQPETITFKAQVSYSGFTIEVRVPFKQLCDRLNQRIKRVALYRDLPRGRKRAGWRQEFMSALKDAAQDLQDISTDEIQQIVRDYRKRRRQQPEIRVVAEAIKI